MKMYFIVYHAIPQPGSRNTKSIAGAYISCWIEAAYLEQADTIERQKINAINWGILERDDAYEINAATYSPESEGLEFYQQALIDKCVLRIHTYPIEELN
jgi:hypothetical protein